MYICIFSRKPLRLSFVQMYKNYLASRLLYILYIHLVLRSVLFKATSQWLFYPATTEQEHVGPNGPLPTLQWRVFYPSTTLWIVLLFYPSNPKSQSRRLLSLCIILLVHAYFYAF